MAIPALAAAVPAIAAGVSAIGQHFTNRSNVQLAREQMQFQERMSSTAHQRETKDLISAGLNPMLSANRGASAPSGAQAHIENAAGAGVSSALAASRAREEIKLLQVQQAKTAEEAKAVGIQNTLWSSPNGDDWNLQGLRARTALTDAEARHITEMLPVQIQEMLKRVEHLATSSKSIDQRREIDRLWEFVEAGNYNEYQKSMLGKVMPYWTSGARMVRDATGAFGDVIGATRWLPRTTEELTEFGSSRSGETGYRRTTRRQR